MRPLIYGKGLILVAAALPLIFQTAFAAAATPAEVIQHQRQDSEKFRAAVESLGRSAASEWVKLLAPGRPAAERVAALEAIEILYRDLGLVRLREEAATKVVPGILPLLDDQSGWVRARAMNTLRALGTASPAAIAKLVRIVRDKNDPHAQQFSTRDCAALALGDIREATPEVLAALMNALTDARAPLRLASLSALRALSWRAQSAIPAIETAAHQNTADFQKKAAEAIAAIQRPKPPYAGDPLPDLQFATLDAAAKRKLSDFRGKIVVMDFWSTTCPPCQPAMDHLQKVATSRPDWRNKVAFLGLTEDDDPKAALRHARQRGWKDLELLHDEDQTAHNTFRAGLPELIVANRGGVILWRGHPTDANLEELISKTLAASDSKK